MANFSHTDFVAGIKDKSLLVVFAGSPYKLLTGVRLGFFYALVSLYMFAPLFLVPAWAYHESNWWLLFGILVSCAGSISAGRESKIIYLFTLFCIIFWFKNGFTIYQYVTYYYFCALWGYLLYQMAEGAQHEYAQQALIESPDLFQSAQDQDQITVVPLNQHGT